MAPSSSSMAVVLLAVAAAAAMVLALDAPDAPHHPGIAMPASNPQLFSKFRRDLQAGTPPSELTTAPPGQPAPGATPPPGDAATNNGNGNGNGTQASTPPGSTRRPRITSSPYTGVTLDPNLTSTPKIEEASFLGLFKTEKLYLAFSLGAPALFLLYKLGLACYFCTCGRRKMEKEDREDEEARKQAAALDAERLAAQAAAAQAAAAAASSSSHNASMSPRKDYHEVEMNTPQAVPLHHQQQHSSASLGGGRSVSRTGINSNFWVEEELQAWRLDFQQLKMMKCLTTTTNQKRHLARRDSNGTSGRVGPAASEVWLATYYAMDAENNQRMVALKWIPPKFKDTELQQEKLKDEIKRQAKLRHPNVAAFLGIAWSPETNLVSVTEYMARGDLRQWLHRSANKERGRWTLAKLKMLLDMSNALVYLHSFQPRLIHGNVNSRNVLLNERLEAKFSDFGAPKDHLTEREIMAYNEVGSGRWISPEALMGRDGAEHVSDAMDVYSLGILMVEMDTHELPFADLMKQDRSQLPENDILQLIANGALSPTLSPSCHPVVERLVRACTAFNPQKRPSSRDIARALRKAFDEMQARGGNGSDPNNYGPRASLV